MWTCRMRAVVGDEHRRGGAAGRRPRGLLLPQGGWSSGDAPPISLLSCQKRNGPCTVQREKRLAHSGAVALRAHGGRRIGACPDLGLPSGTLYSPATFGTAVPWRMVPTSSGWLTHGPASIFAAAGCSSRERKRQRGGRLRVSPTSPGRRFPQGPGVSVPDFYTGQPTIPRRRQEGRIYAARPAEAIFSLGPSTARSLFVKNKKRMGGGMSQLASQLNPPGGRLPPLRRLRKKAPLWGRGEKKRRPAFRPAASRSAVTPKIPSGCGPPPPPR